MLFAEAFVTMLVILDLVGNVPVFLALTKDHDTGRRRRASLEATAVAASVILVVFAALANRSSSCSASRCRPCRWPGGLVLVLVALEILGSTQKTGHSADVRNPALVPLGTPLLAGPGAVAATMVYIRRSYDVGEAMLVVVVAIMAALAVVYIALRSAVGLARLLGSAGIESPHPRRWGCCWRPSPCSSWPRGSTPGCATASE